MTYHDPHRQINLLRQSLEDSKRSIAILLGAGCPLSIRVSEKPLIPDIAGMTEYVIQDVGASDLKEAFASIRSHLEASPKPVNLEDYLSHTRSLKDIATRVAVSEHLNEKILQDLDERICESVVKMASVGLPSPDTPYHKLAAWIRGIPRISPVQLFTLNYDLLIEQALEDTLVPYFDGFIGSRDAFFDPYAIESEEQQLPPRWVRLWKLHGSINWWMRRRAGITEIVRKSGGMEEGERRLIHPSHLKYEESRQMPYLSMMDRLKVFLQQPGAVLITCGYRFADQHINALLRQTLAHNATAITFGLLHGELASYTEANQLASTTHNLKLLAKDKGIIATREGSWGGTQRDDVPIATGVEPSPDSPEDELVKYQVTLGDFSTLGSLFTDLLGEPGDTRVSGGPTERKC